MGLRFGAFRVLKLWIMDLIIALRGREVFVAGLRGFGAQVPEAKLRS